MQRTSFSLSVTILSLFDGTFFITSLFESFLLFVKFVVELTFTSSSFKRFTLLSSSSLHIRFSACCVIPLKLELCSVLIGMATTGLSFLVRLMNLIIDGVVFAVGTVFVVCPDDDDDVTPLLADVAIDGVDVAAEFDVGVCCVL